VSEKRTAVRGDQDSNPALPAGIQDRQLIIMTKSTHLYRISHSRFGSMQGAVRTASSSADASQATHSSDTANTFSCHELQKPPCSVLLTSRGTHSYYTCSVVTQLAFSSKDLTSCNVLPALLLTDVAKKFPTFL
jgi:hypothetical protein